MARVKSINKFFTLIMAQDKNLRVNVYLQFSI